MEWTTQNANVHTQCVLQHVMIVVSLFHFSYGRNGLETNERNGKNIFMESNNPFGMNVRAERNEEEHDCAMKEK